MTRVFLPMLSNTRQPPYKSLTVQERLDLPEEKNKQLYLSSIRGADEWSYKEFEAYVDYMLKGDTNYITVALPYHFGVKNRYINRDIVEQEFRNNKDSLPMVRAEFLAIPERGNEDAFFKYDMLEKARDNVKALYAMSDEEYIVYRNRKNEWKFYVEKLSNEIRILSMDVALLESAQNDNTSFWITRLIPDGTSYKKLVAYGESMHGLNSIIQMKRAKQLFYEMECDYFVLDTQGVGMSIFDLSTTPTYDEVRDVTYPAWTVLNPDDVKMSNRTIDPDAVPLIYSVKTPIQLKSEMFLNMRNMLSSGKVSLLSETQEAIDYMTPIYKFYKIEDSDLRVRLLNPYVQTNLLINEAVNLEQVATQGYINLKEKAGRRKDRVMSLAYNLYYTKLLEDANRNQSDDNLLDYVMFV